jgi:hypothetical protein
MKYLKPAASIAAAISMGAAPLHAGGAAAPRMEPEVLSPEIIAEESASSGGFILPLIFLVIIAATASGGLPRE